MTPKIIVMSASVGAGHDGAAAELGRRLGDLGFLVQHLDFLDMLPGRAGAAVRRAYTAELMVAPRTWGWLLSALQRHGWLSAAAVSLTCQAASRRTRQALAGPVAAVVSTYPLASQVLGQMRRDGQLTAPVITFLTDMSVHPLWIARGVDEHLALHEVAAAQARSLGAAGVVVSGPAVAPGFHPVATAAERAVTRQSYGIPVDVPVALVVAGSWGVGEVEATVRDIANSAVAMPVTLCGNNRSLQDRLVKLGLGPALGWVGDMAPLIRACDVVVQNAGGLTSLEAMACGVPVVTYRCLPGHGFTNAAALQQAGLAPWAHEPHTLRTMLLGALVRPSGGRAVAELNASGDPAAVIAELAGVTTVRTAA